jgi:hypothetical protein
MLHAYKDGAIIYVLRVACEPPHELTDQWDFLNNQHKRKLINLVKNRTKNEDYESACLLYMHISKDPKNNCIMHLFN